MVVETNIIYFDNAATTKVDDDVLNTYNQVSKNYFANTSSNHALGQRSFNLLEKARKQIIDVFHLPNHEVIFTSGATEANNLAIKGVCLNYQSRGKHIIVSEIEHPSVLETVKQLHDLFGYEVTYLKVDITGRINIDELKHNIRKDTVLVSIMAVNNEVGSINDIERICGLLEEYKKIVFHVDATQAIGKVDIDFSRVDMFTYSGHKIHSLKNSGVLIKKKNISLLPVNNGGGQENNIRSGTVDLALAVCISKATRIAIEKSKKEIEHIKDINLQIRGYLMENHDLYHINSDENCSPYIVNFSLKTKKASVVVEALSNNNIMVSSISACHSRKESYSHVIKAMFNDEELAKNTVRISLDASNTLEEANRFISTLDNIIKEVKFR